LLLEDLWHIPGIMKIVQRYGLQLGTPHFDVLALFVEVSRLFK
jgi:hypothetical protein